MQTVLLIPSRAKPVRRNELDWLRAFAVLGLIPFHAAVVFTTGSGDYVKNAETSRGVDVLVSFISMWGMPLIFLIAGAGARFALQLRTPQLYLRERFTRLVIPLLFGMLAIVPLQVYIGRAARTGTGALPPFIPFYADHMLLLLGILRGAVPPNGNEWIGHLWFIPMLILFAVLILPVDWYFHTAPGQRVLAVLTTDMWGARLLLLFGFLPGLAQFLLRGGATVNTAVQPMAGWFLLLLFLVFYLAGYVIYADRRLEAAVRAAGVPALLAAGLLWGAVEMLNLTGRAPAPGVSLAYACYSLLSGYASWLWVVAILSVGMRFLTRTNGVLRYLNDATYPAYVLHLPILSLIALYVVRWDLPLLAKLVVITLATLTVTLAFFDLVVKRAGIVRVLFGLKPRPPRRPYNPTPPSELSTPVSETAVPVPAGRVEAGVTR